jgi:hypothetical protein
MIDTVIQCPTIASHDRIRAEHVERVAGKFVEVIEEMIDEGMMSASQDPLKNSRLRPQNLSLKNNRVSRNDLEDLRRALIEISNRLEDQLVGAERPELTYDIKASPDKWSERNPVRGENIDCLCKDLKELVRDYNEKRP